MATIDHLIASERRRNLAWALLGGGLVALLLLFVLFATYPGETTEIGGVVMGVLATPTEDGHRLYVRVALDSGGEVRARARRTTNVVKGDRVVVSEVRSYFGNRVRYWFLREEQDH